MNLWEQIKERLSQTLSAESYQNWLLNTGLHHTEGEVLWISVPDETTKVWLEEEYGEQVTSAIFELRLPVRRVSYLLGNLSPTAVPPVVEASPGGESLFTPLTAHLNPKFTFESFVVGSCNQFAHAAAKNVATFPSRSYNPLFIYGGVGMGKTHLMHAIGRSLLNNFGSMRIVYTTSERFMNQMINCIKMDRMPMFHQHYRNADVLLVDDIQILAGKERTQEEFFHTFNELYDHQKQIVISSDSPPKSTIGLVERLRSRFEWGLLVDVQPPDLETKMAILDRKAELEGVDLPENVRTFIATRTKSNIRELEGALVKLIAYSAVTGVKINLAMAQQILKHLSAGLERKVTIDAIVRYVAEKFSLQPSQLKQKINARQIVHPRQIAMYLAKELTQASLPEIGRAFGGKHHTTVLHSIQKIERERHKKPDLHRFLHNAIDSFH